MMLILHDSSQQLIAIEARSLTLTVEDLAAGLPSKWQAAAATFKSTKRQKEYLAVRQLLYQVVGGEFDLSYLESGQPMIQGTDYQHIAISHTEAYAAIFLHRDQQVGIDIEHISPKPERLRERFLRPSELSFLQKKTTQKAFFYTLYWSAKESLYKYFGEKKLHFKNQLEIVDILEKSMSKGELSAIIYNKKGEEQAQITVYYQVIGTHILTHCSA